MKKRLKICLDKPESDKDWKLEGRVDDNSLAFKLPGVHGFQAKYL
jgi:hypothetical protein